MFMHFLNSRDSRHRPKMTPNMAPVGPAGTWRSSLFDSLAAIRLALL
jgi:hypothetical protein